ncbi:hypothetical protein NEMIN01_1947 [Nematocida minor]|uniref:uncharacterized protein n=1 Tax=Nematocida minor TaxID=1912983 RepID=UPI00221E75C1|nr:uncharacterized protein NEMIN01_1947 [Nematocida minor]KAI5192318.1 hypothetical protein NEMIN01_1947 [Nematocida minor]
MSTTESECLQLINQGTSDFFHLAQKYKLEIIESRKPTDKSDLIFSYFLLHLLASGDTRRYCLNRAELAAVVESGEFACVRTLDHLWKSSLLGDIPQMKHALDTLPHTHQQIGVNACKSLQEKPVKEGSEQFGGKGSKIQQIIKASNMFFRV